MKGGSASAFDLVADKAQPGTVRVEALRSLAVLKDAKLNDAVKLAQADADEGLRKEASKIQAQLKPGDATARLRTTLDTGTPGEKQSAFATLGTLNSTSADELLAQWVDKLLARQARQASREQDLVHGPISFPVGRMLRSRPCVSGGMTGST